MKTREAIGWLILSSPRRIVDFTTARINIPTLVMHGDADRILPITAAGQRTAKLIKGARLVVVEGGPHCITWTHSEIVNRELLAFLAEKPSAPQKGAAAK